MPEKRQEETHEAISRENEVQVGSDRSFGVVFSVFFTIVGLVPLVAGGGLRTWSLGVAGVFLGMAIAIPRVLHPLNVAWMTFGSILHRVVSPVVLGLLFFLTITPMAILIRVLGKDLLRLRFDRAAKTYWIARDPPGPPPVTMKNQF